MEVEMRKLAYLLTIFAALSIISLTVNAGGAGSGGYASDFTTLNLTLDNETITSEQDLTALDPGLYEFIVQNESSEKVEFVIQDLKTERVLGKIKIKPNKFKKARVKITKNGFKYQKSNDIWHEFSVN